MSKLVGTINEVKELVKDNPVLLQRLEHASKVASTANTHVTAANNAISEVRGNLASIPSVGQWGDNWSLPPRVPPNPEIYEDPSTRPRK